jgi:hypothetical protein
VPGAGPGDLSNDFAGPKRKTYRKKLLNGYKWRFIAGKCWENHLSWICGLSMMSVYSQWESHYDWRIE